MGYCSIQVQGKMMLKSRAREKGFPSISVNRQIIFNFLKGQYKQSGIESHLQVIHRRQDTYPSVFVLNKHKLNVLPLCFHFTQSLIRERYAKKMIHYSKSALNLPILPHRSYLFLMIKFSDYVYHLK